MTYHVDYLGELLRNLSFTPKEPARVSRRKDPRAAEEFRRETWPQARKKGRKDAALLAVDECEFCEKPLVKHTWAPCGQTPTLKENGSWGKLTAIGVLSLQPSGRLNEQFQLLRGSAKTLDFDCFFRPYASATERN